MSSTKKKKPNSSRLSLVMGLVALATITVGIAAYGTNTWLRGHVAVTQHGRIESPVSKTIEKARTDSAAAGKAVSDLVDRYGVAAMSPTVVAAIRKAESTPSLNAAKTAADKYEALKHGYMQPGTDPMLAIMHGYAPPGMQPQQAAMLYGAIPHIPQMPQPMTPELVARMAGEPTDSLAGLPQGFSQDGIQAANQQMFEGYMRERFGPVYVPPLHRDHNRAPQPTTTSIATISGYDSTKERQGSIREMVDASGNIVAEYAYDPYGRQTRIAGTGPDADFGYQGYYKHPRSGFDLTATRAYSPNLGRFLNRDVIGETMGRGGTNLYSYVRNNPISLSDPLGLYAQGVYSIGNHTLNMVDDNGNIFNTSDIFSGSGPFANEPLAAGIPYNGPIPPGSYQIPPETTMPDNSFIPWFQLVPNQPSLCPWRTGCGAHPGLISKGCMTFPGVPFRDSNGNLTGYFSPSFNDFANYINGQTPMLINSPSPSQAYISVGNITVVP